MYTTSEIISLLNVSRPTLYKILGELDFHPKRTSKNGKYLFSKIDLFFLKKYLSSRGINKKLFLNNLYEDVLKMILLYSKQIDPQNGEKFFNEFFKSYKKDIILNKTTLN